MWRRSVTLAAVGAALAVPAAVGAAVDGSAAAGAAHRGADHGPAAPAAPGAARRGADHRRTTLHARAASARRRADRRAAAVRRMTHRAVRYLVRAQNRDGGFGSTPRAGSAAMTTSWAALGLAAAGRAPARIARRGGASLAAAVARTARDARSTGDLERAVLALHAAGRPIPERILERLLARHRPDGSFDGQTTLTAFGILALRAAGRPATDPVVASAAAFVAAQQNDDGGFHFAGRGGPSGVDDTAAALQALVAAGRDPDAPEVRRAADFLAAQQRRDGGFPLVPGAPSNAQSTAWAVQALAAAGRPVARLRRPGGRTPLGHLRSLQARSGAIRYSRTSRQTPVWVTAQALTALAHQPLPIAPLRSAPRSRPRAIVVAR